MSSTDVAMGGMIPPAARPQRTFGMRRIPPSPFPPVPTTSPEWQHVQLLRDRLTVVLTTWLKAVVPPLKASALYLKALAPPLKVLAPPLRALALSLKAVAPSPKAVVLSFKARALSLKPNLTWSRKAAVRALLHTELRSTLLRLLAYLAALALLAIGTAQIFRSAPLAAAIEPAPRADWIEVGKPFPAFALAMPELAEAGLSYGLRRHVTGGGRRDVMTWGEWSGTGPHLVVEVYRPGTEFTRFADIGQEIAARTEGHVLAKNIKPADMLESKFGAVSLAEFAANDGPRRCVGFARPFTHPHLQIAGWYCTTGPELIERNVIACALDRLSLLSAGGDEKVGQMFAGAELKRNFCGQRSILLAATPKHGPGPSISPEMKLRGRFSAR